MRDVLRQPLPLAEGVCVVPEQAPPVAPKALSTVSSLATAWRAPCLAASATVDDAQSTRNTSMLIASRKKSKGKMRANSTRAWPRLRLISVLAPLEGGDREGVRRARDRPQ